MNVLLSPASPPVSAMPIARLSPRATLLLVVGAVTLITLLHYLTSAHLLPYHAIYRSLYYVPIGVAAVVWGTRGGVLTASSVALLYLPHALIMTMAPSGKLVDNLLEMISMTVVAVVIGMLANGERHQRHQTEVLRAYITDVLASLPVGVATMTADAQLQPQNPAAISLLDHVTPADLPSGPGYVELHARPVALRRSVLHGRDGAPIGAVVVLEDLSEQRRLAEQVRQAEHLVALGQLAGGLAHEVRNPLGIVRATAQLLSRKLHGQPAVAEHVRVLTVEADRIDRLIGELLTYATPRPPAWEVIPVAPFLAELATALAPLATHHQVQVDLLPPAPTLQVQADGEHLRQALLNVVLNAIQASTAGQTVTLQCAAEADTIIFQVDDAGAGVPDHLRSRIFDPFFTTRDEGTGMGLAVVARIISQHRGTIQLDGRTEGGTRTTIRLPRMQEAP